MVSSEEELRTYMSGAWDTSAPVVFSAESETRFLEGLTEGVQIIARRCQADPWWSAPSPPPESLPDPRLTVEFTLPVTSLCQVETSDLSANVHATWTLCPQQPATTQPTFSSSLLDPDEDPTSFSSQMGWELAPLTPGEIQARLTHLACSSQRPQLERNVLVCFEHTCASVKKPVTLRLCCGSMDASDRMPPRLQKLWREADRWRFDPAAPTPLDACCHFALTTYLRRVRRQEREQVAVQLQEELRVLQAEFEALPSEIHARWERREADGWRTVFLSPQPTVAEVYLKLVLILLQEGMISGDDVELQSVRSIQQELRLADADQGVVYEKILPKVRRLFTEPEDSRALPKYIRRILAEEAAKDPYIASDITPETVQEVAARMGQGRSYLRSQRSSADEGYTVATVLRRLAHERQRAVQADEKSWTPSRDTLYDWITKGHRWYGKIDAVHDTRRRLRITDQGVAQVYLIVQAENRCEKLRNRPGMTAANLKKLYQRYKKPDGTPDLDAIEGHVARRSCKTKDRAPLEDMLSIEDQMAVLKARLAEEEMGSDAWCVLQDTLQQLQQHHPGTHP